MARPTRSVNQSNSAVKTEPFDHLIQHVKQYDVRLYEALKRATDQITQIQNVTNEVADFKEELKATFGMNKNLEDTSISLTNYYICKRGGNFVEAVAKIQTETGEAPTGQDAVLDILISKNDAATWNSIFDHTLGFSEGLIVLPAGLTPLVKQTRFVIPSIKKYDLLKIICTQKGLVAAGRGIEVVLEWE